MRSLSTEAYAKINLFLDVTGKRGDGYHTIESIMQHISLSDTVSVTRADDCCEITVSCTDPTVPTDSRNIVYKCASLFFDHFDIADRGIHIRIEKRIPSCGGLAGGSTDGAAVLRLMNEVYGIHASNEALCEIGVKAGADIPFCIVGGTCICKGIGERLTPVSIPSPRYQVLISFPGEGISTPEAYRAIDRLSPLQSHPDMSSTLDALQMGCIPTKMYNAFEAVVLPHHSNARLVKQTMLDSGAVSAMMSGSGSTVFGLFEKDGPITSAADALEKKGFDAHICRPVV